MTVSDEDIPPTPFGQPVTSEQIGFAPDELIECGGCGKLNGPDRQRCLYCGKALPQREQNSSIANAAFRRLEPWEPGVNVIMSAGNPAISNEDADAVSKIIAVTASDLRSMIGSGTPLPIVRVADAESAERIVSHLGNLGFGTQILPDRLLDPEHPPIRLRSVDVRETAIVLNNFNSGEATEVPFEEIALLVTGRIYESRREEVTKRKRGATQVIEEFETSDDLGLVDIYTLNDSVGFRVQTNGFDFSVLGEDKGLLAEPNLRKFSDLLLRHSANAQLADEYDSVRSFLDLVWEPSHTKDSEGLQVRGYGKREFGATFSTSNASQFTKYSRMRRLML